MKIWRVGTINEECEYWAFRDKNHEKYKSYDWDGSWIDNWYTIDAIVKEKQVRFGFQRYLDVILSGKEEVLQIKKAVNLSSVQFLPFECNENNDKELFIWNVLKVENALDEENCELEYFPSGRVRKIAKYSFNEDVVKNLGIFKIQYGPATIYVTDEFKNAFENLGFKGLSFSCVWDYEEKEIEKVENNNANQDKFIEHIEKHIGKVINVYREPLNIDMMFDVLVVENNNYKALVTNGLRNFDLNVPMQLHEFKNIEVMMFLDKSFDISQEGLEKEENKWVIDLIKSIGSYPVKYNSYLNWGHTLTNGADEKPYCSKVNYSSVFIYPPTVQNDVTFYCYNDGTSNNYIYNIMPIYKEEKEFIMSHTGDDFFDLMGDRNINQIITLNRVNIIK